MAVVSVSKLFQGQTASRTEDGRREYSVRYQVEVDDPQDGENVVLGAAAVALGMAQIGQVYTFGNDADGLATCVSLAPGRVDGTRVVWVVDAVFRTTETGDSGGPRVGADGQKSDDPDDWREEFEVDSALFSVPVELATLRTNITGGRQAGSFGAVINAAGEPFDPPLEAEYACDVLRIMKYSRIDGYPSAIAAEYKNAINSDEFSITKPGYGRTFDPLTIKMLPIRGSLNYHRTQAGVILPYWRIYIELHEKKLVLSNDVTITWRFTVLNRGDKARACPGDPDGNGGTISSDSLATIGRPKFRMLVDQNGDPVDGPVTLDLSGKPLACGAAETWLVYSFFPEKPFSALNL